MASFGSQNTGCTPSEGTSVPVTPSCNDHFSVYSTVLKYKLYPVEVVFLPLGESWVFDVHVLPKTMATVFTELEGFEGQTTTYESTMTDIVLAGLWDKYSILDEYILLFYV